MQVAGLRFRTLLARAAVAAAGLMALLNVRPESTRLAEAAGAPGAVARRLILSDQARRYLALQYRSYPTEFMGCMIGEAHGPFALVRRIAPADVDPGQSTPTRVIPTASCEHAGWAGTIGVIHSHPDAKQCWYYFPGTQVLSSDGQSFARQSYLVDAIMCGDRVVWISRDMRERQLSPISLPGRSNGRAPL